MTTVGLAVLALATAIPIGSQDWGSDDSFSEKARRTFHGNLAAHEAGEILSVLLYLDEHVDVKRLDRSLEARRAPLRERHEEVVVALQSQAASTQAGLLDYLAGRKAAGTVVDYEPFWVVNMVRVEADRDEVARLAERDDVGRIYYDYPIEPIEPVASSADDAPPGGRAVENGVAAVRAPEVWAMGYTGEGVLVANLDTGVDGNHPALASRWAGVADPRYAGHPEWAWYDPYLGQNNFPYDNGGHGTHTMGSVCGGPPGDEIGVAPGAYWIAAAPIDRESISRTISDAILSFQWMVDPDGNPTTNWDVPAVCSNSWGLVDSHGVPPCDETFWGFLDACEAAGTVILFSAGNEGSAGLRRPADRATDAYRTCAVAAVDANTPGWPIASFSSRGPTYCTPTGTPAIKPDIAAPGVDVRSAWPGGGYTSLSGTSMASPHVNGVVALMRQANPDLSVEQVKQIIYDTAFDLGSPGEDNDYGWGMIDAYEAVNEALATATLSFQFPAGLPEFVSPAGGTTIRVEVTGHASTPEPGSGMLYWDTGTGTYTAVPMIEVETDVYDAVFPAFDCGATVTYYFSVDTTDEETIYNPYTAPDRTYEALAYEGIVIAFEDDFQADTGWTVQNDPGLTTGAWERGVPVGGGDRGDPASDQDGSGACFVTDNRDGDYDIDDGRTWMISPVFDLSSSLDPRIEYAVWYTNNYGADPNNDLFHVHVSNDAGASWILAETIGPTSSSGWSVHGFQAADYVALTDQMRVRFEASDLNSPSVVEAGVDAFRVFSYDCGTSAPPDMTVAISADTTVVPRGSYFVFDVEVASNDPVPHDFEIWATRILPDSTVQDPWKGPKARTIGANQTKTWADRQFRIGPTAPLGTYRLYIRLGEQFPQPLWAEDFIEYTVVE
jgi:bacillopeptidase F